jgi:hypothetical protein
VSVFRRKNIDALTSASSIPRGTHQSLMDRGVGPPTDKDGYVWDTIH